MKEKKYYIFYKPCKVLSQFTDDALRSTLYNFIKFEKDIYPVGRLDYDSEGLLILTNDNYLKMNVIDPKKHHKKIYYVQVEGIVKSSELEKLFQGVKIKSKKVEYIAKPISCSIISEPDLPSRNPPIRYRKNIETSWMEIIISEGKNHQIRKMTAAIGLPTLRLIRVAIEDLKLNNMLPGDVLQISQNSIYKKLKIPLLNSK